MYPKNALKPPKHKIIVSVTRVLYAKDYCHISLPKTNIFQNNSTHWLPYSHMRKMGLPVLAPGQVISGYYTFTPIKYPEKSVYDGHRPSQKPKKGAKK